MKPEEHNRIIGITHLAYGSFHLLMLMLFSFFFLFILALPHRGNGDISIFTVFMLIVLVFGLLFTLPSLIAGYALLKHKSWARTVAIFAGILATPGFPYGTALGVYTLSFMFGNEGKEFYARNADAWPSKKPGALPEANGAENWVVGGPYNEREREYVPPPQMPNWR